MDKETAIEILEKFKDTNQITSDSVSFWWEDIQAAIDEAVEAMAIFEEYEGQAATIAQLDSKNDELEEKISELENEIITLNERIHELELNQIITFKRKDKSK